MRARGPHLLPVDDKMVATVDGAGAQAGEVAAGIGLGIALAPQLVGAENARQMPLFLLLGSPVDEGRAQQVQRARRRQDGRAGAEIFLVENDLLHKAGAAPAIFLRPGDPDPAGGVHLLLPGNALFQCLAIGRDALVGGIVDADLRRQVFFEPVAEFGAESRVLGAVGDAPPRYRGIFRQQDDKGQIVFAVKFTRLYRGCQSPAPGSRSEMWITIRSDVPPNIPVLLIASDDAGCLSSASSAADSRASRRRSRRCAGRSSGSGRLRPGRCRAGATASSARRCRPVRGGRYRASMPRSCMCGSFMTSGAVRTGAHGMRYALARANTSIFGGCGSRLRPAHRSRPYGRRARHWSQSAGRP